MRDNAMQQEIWELECRLFDLRSLLAIWRSKQDGSKQDVYEKRLAMAQLHRLIHEIRRERMKLVDTHPVEPPHNTVAQSSLFGLEAVAKKRRKR